MKSLISTFAQVLIFTISITYAQCQRIVNRNDSTEEKYVYEDGSVYYGELRNGLPEGTGTVNYASGNWYYGGWKDHAPHGKGVMYWVNGQKKIRGMWNKGQLVEVLPEQASKEPAIAEKSAFDQKVRIWAIVIGVAQYQHWPSLRFADDDAYQVHSFLKSPAGGALPNEQIRLLIDEAATRNNILDALYSLSGQIDENDVVYFYFSGHGLQDAFLPSDYDGTRNKLRHREIVAALNNTRANKKFIIADACHSGGMLAAKSPVMEAVEKFYAAFEGAKNGTAMLFSSKNEEYSLEDRGLRSGVFSHYLIKGINGAADVDNDKIVTVSELYDFVNRKVRTHTRNLQTPILRGRFDENMPVATVL